MIAFSMCMHVSMFTLSNVISYEFRVSFSLSVNADLGILIGIARNWQNTLCIMGILSTLFLLFWTGPYYVDWPRTLCVDQAGLN